MSRLLSSIAAISLALSPAHAQSVEAETLFVDGEKAMAAGQYDKACEAFAASNRIEERAGTLINLGLCEEKRERFASAWIAFREALTRVKDPVKKQVATERSAAVEAKMSYLTIELPDASKVDGLAVTRDGQPVDPALFGRAIPIDGGKHTVVARAPGRTAWTGDVMIAKERDKSTVLIPLLAAETTTGVAPPIERPPAIETSNRHRGLVIAFGTVAVAGLAVGVYGSVRSRQLDTDANGLCPDLSMPCADADRANDLLDRRDTHALVANLGFGVAAVGALAAGIAWYTGRSSPRADVAVVPMRDGANIMVRVGF
ncbi:MAG: tetratricopeptide repeat protein [Kofleriaceae bacterium]